MKKIWPLQSLKSLLLLKLFDRSFYKVHTSFIQICLMITLNHVPHLLLRTLRALSLLLTWITWSYWLQSLRKTNAKGPENAEFGNKPIEGVPELSDAEKFFRCPKCDKSYQHPDSIRKHCRKAHKIFVINCRHCFIVFLTAEEKAEHFALVHKNSAASPG